MDYIDLRTLPEEHPLRNAPLDKIGAEYKSAKSWEWHRVETGRTLANNTFNELEGVWATHIFEWRCSSTTATKEKS